MHQLNNRESYHHPVVSSGPRPKVKATLLVDGIPVRVCESLEEMRVRLSGLRKRGDKRSVERILYDQDDTRARARKSYQRGDSKNE